MRCCVPSSDFSALAARRCARVQTLVQRTRREAAHGRRRVPQAAVAIWQQQQVDRGLAVPAATTAARQRPHTGSVTVVEQRMWFNAANDQHLVIWCPGAESC